MAATVVNFRVEESIRKKVQKVLKKENITESEFLRNCMYFVADKGVLPVKKEYVLLPVLGTVGDEKHPGDSVETIQKRMAFWELQQFFDKENVLKPKIITALDNLLMPEIEKDDCLGVDCSVTSFTGNGTYITEHLNEAGEVKGNSDIAIIRQSPSGEYTYIYDMAKPVTLADLSSVKILGKVVKVVKRKDVF